MAKYHINAKGEPGVCEAKKACPFGDLEADHYTSMSEARDAYETYATEFLLNHGHSKVALGEQLALFPEEGTDENQEALFEM